MLKESPRKRAAHKAQNVNLSYACRLMKLTILSPSIVERALDGRLPGPCGLKDLIKSMPSIWSEQTSRLGK